LPACVVLFSMFLELFAGSLPSYSIENTSQNYVSPVVQVDLNSQKTTLNQEFPLRVIIPNSKIDLAIEKGKIEGETWDLNDHSALYAEGSSDLTTKNGNTILYAHARLGLFYNLRYTALDDKIYVLGEKNIHEYSVTNIEKILPNQVDVLKKGGEHNLSLFTCEGYGDEYRLVIRAQRTSSIELHKEVI
jgi:LPXTG-site transpeptidase (sortase) family protein